jgi:hypothetical protein
VLEQASETVWTVSFKEELDAFLFFIFIDERVFLDEVCFTMGKLTFVSIATGASGHPVLAHLCFVQ